MNPYAPRKDKKEDPIKIPEAPKVADALTICYITARKDPKEEWFLDSLERQINGRNVSVIIVDLWADSRNKDIGNRNFVWSRVSPKPNAWCGPNRLTKQNWWAASSFRNTALCLCRTDFIAYVDDCSVLLDSWLDRAYEATSRSETATAGAYQKVKQLVVENGQVKSFEEFEEGIDHRVRNSPKRDLVRCHGSWVYGCSLILPVESLLRVGGWPEFCDGASGEDTSLGLMLEGTGTYIMFDNKMKTLESEEDHQYTVGSDHMWVDGVRIACDIKRADKGKIGTPDSKSWEVFRKAANSLFFDNYYPGGMRELRKKILAGESFPVLNLPTHDFYDNQPLSEM